MRIQFTDSLRKSHGLYTDKHVARCSEVGGQFRQDLQRLFHDNIGSERGQLAHVKRVDTKDVQHFIENYAKDNLWGFVPGRFHVGFESMKHEWRVKNCAKFTEKLLSLSQSLDLWRNFVE